MSNIDQRVAAARMRLWFNRYMHYLGTCLAWGCLPWLLMVLIEKVFAVELPLLYGAGICLLAGTLAATIWLTVRAEDRFAAAVALDEAAAVKERLSTALYLRASSDPFAQAVVADAERTASLVRVRNVLPLRYPGRANHAAVGWLAALLIVWLLPTLDVLGREQAARKQQDQVAKTRQMAAAVKPKIQEIQKKAADIPSLQKPAQDLQQIQENFDKLNKPPEQARVETVKALTSVQQEVKQQQGYLQQQTEAMRTSLTKASLAATGSEGVVRELAKALASGDYKTARAAVQDLQAKIQQAADNPEKARELANQLQGLADALSDQKLQKELADALKAGGASEAQIQKLEQAMAAGEQPSPADMQNLQQALQKGGLSPGQASELMQRLAAAMQGAGMCNKLGTCLGGACKGLRQMAEAPKDGQGQGQKPGQGQGAGQKAGSGQAGQAGQCMAGAGAQLGQMEALQQEVASMQALLADIQGATVAVAAGPGQTGSFAPGSSNRRGMGMGGPGIGEGGVAPEQQTPFALQKTKSPSAWTPGSLAAEYFVDGNQLKGESKKGFVDAVTAAQNDATKAIDEHKLPPQYDGPVKKYFDGLRQFGQSGGQAASQPDAGD